jgi:hypothetical protein
MSFTYSDLQSTFDKIFHYFLKIIFFIDVGNELNKITSKEIGKSFNTLHTVNF